MKTTKKFFHITVFILLSFLSVNAQGQIDTEFTFLNGSAIYIDNNDETCIQLTPSEPNRVGSTFYREPLLIQDGFDVNFRVLFGPDSLGGEGIVFVIHSLYEGFNLLGNAGNTIGYDGIDRSLGIVFDTHYTPDSCDQMEGNYIKLVRDGNLCDILAGPVSPISQDTVPTQGTININNNIEDGESHFIRITWDPINQYLQVFFDGKLRLVYQEDIANTIFNSDTIYFGATASTGSSFSTQQICLGSLPELDFNPVEEGCIDTSKFSNWYQAGDPDNGNWITEFSGELLKQTVNSRGPTFFVTPFELIDVEIFFTVSVDETEDSNDNDDIGFVFGYEAPFGNNFEQFKTYLFSHRKEDDTGCGNYLGQEGEILAEIDGEIPFGCDPFGTVYHFWGQISSPAYKILDSRLGDGNGWQYDVEQNFKLIYTRTEAIILRMGTLQQYDTLFHLQGCFEPGRFGFYNNSQGNANHKLFSYQYHANFTMEESEICVGTGAEFLFLEDCNEEFDFTSIDSLVWDFGDGSMLRVGSPNAQNVNPVHTYFSAGTYLVQLTVENALGCRGSISKEIIVKTLPLINLGNDTIICATETLELNTNAIGDAYSWSNGDSTINTFVMIAGTQRNVCA